ncbi:MAG TPA: GrpB family protein [Candidatus Baltobacteraceae bacterium]|nr:GrpB family protein [Candidatus Baltobacteraceae bacterium]
MNGAPHDAISPEERAEPVVVVPYDPAWEGTFRRVRERVAGALGDLAVGVEHVGSTAVPGLAAKPIVDVDAIVRRAEDVPEAIRALAAIGYAHLGDLGIAGREAFRAPSDLPRHHLYVCAVATPELRAHLAFRDALRADRALAERYAALKRDLAERYRDDRDAYTEGKSAFVRSVLRGEQKDRRRRR